MIPGLHGFDLIIILVIALLVFGPKKLPEMGAAVGKSIKEFQKGMKELTASKEEKEAEENKREIETLEREIASKKAAATARETVQPEVDVTKDKK